VCESARHENDFKTSSSQGAPRGITMLLATVVIIGQTVSVEDTVLVYNRVAKAGSTFLTELLSGLSKRNHFHMRYSTSGVRPSGEELQSELRSVSNGTVWIRHAGFWDAAPAHFTWVNLVRDPLDRFRSLYEMYATIGLSRPSRRQSIKVMQRNYAALAKDAACGCWNTSFAACISASVERNCSLCIPSQMAYFCPPADVDGVDEGMGNFRRCDTPRFNCTAQAALQRLRTRYKAVGLEEEMDASIQLFERLLPQFFTGATALARRMMAGPKPLPFASHSNGSRKGIPQSLRTLLVRAYNFEAERDFYHGAKLQFRHALRDARDQLLQGSAP